MLRDQLLSNGVDAAAIEVIPDEAQSVSSALEMANEGDLVVLFVDNISRCWNQVIHFEGQTEVTVSADTGAPVHSFVESDPDAFTLDEGVRLVRDERGVRVARDEESD